MDDQALAQLYADHTGKVSDKWSFYFTAYDRIFSEFRASPVRLFEIGIQNGGSLEIWSKYFPRAQKLIGCDINPACARLSYEDPRIAVVVGDANSDAVQAAVLEHSPAFDVIIDDGSHRSSDVVKSFARYFPQLADGGVYVVEDLHCSYWREFEGGLFDPFSSMTFFKRLADIVSHEHWNINKSRLEILGGFFSKYGFQMPRDSVQHVRSIEFANSLCVIRKSTPDCNRLGARVIAGSEAIVAPAVLERRSEPDPVLDQTGNEWTARGLPPDEELIIRVEELSERNRQLHNLSQVVADRDERILVLNQIVSDRDGQLGAIYQDVTERDGQIANLNQLIAERDGQIANLNQRMAERDGQIANLNPLMAERDGQVANLNQLVSEREGQIAHLNKLVSEREGQIAHLNQLVSEREGQIAHLNQLASERDAAIAAIRASNSWRVTAPLRLVGNQVRRAQFVLQAAPHILHLGGGIAGTLRKAWLVLHKEGWSGVKWRVVFAGSQRNVSRSGGDHSALVQYRDLTTDAGRALLQARLGSLAYKPLISVVMPVYNTAPKLLIEAVESVLAQVYQGWDLCICDDGSTNAKTLVALSSFEGSDERIKVERVKRNAGISTATNMAVRRGSGEFVALLDHDDLLTPDALAEVVLTLNSLPEVDVLYSDQDKIDEDGNVSEPFFKPDWSPDYFRRVMYVGHLLVFRRSLFDKVGGFDAQFDNVQDYEFMLRLFEAASRIHHIPKILYHWRVTQGSIAQRPDGKSGVEQLQRKAVESHLARCGISAGVRTHPRFPHRVVIEPPPREHWPLVSVVIPSKDAPQHIGRCLESIYARSTYSNLEVVVVDNGTTDREALAVLTSYPVKVVPFDRPFNYSLANNLGVAEARGQFLVLLNNDTQVVTPNWVEVMLFHLEQDDVAAVGPLLLYPDGTVQHAGVVLGARGTADHVMRRFSIDCDGYAGSLSCTREVSAVTAACLMCRRADYLSSGGMIEFFSTHYQDVDFCLRLAASGRRILFVPQAVLYHFEGATRGSHYDHLDRLLLLDRWNDAISRGDRYYNPNLSLERLDYSVDERVKLRA